MISDLLKGATNKTHSDLFIGVLFSLVVAAGSLSDSLELNWVWFIYNTLYVKTPKILNYLSSN